MGVQPYEAGMNLPPQKPSNHRVENTPATYQARLEKAACRIVTNAAELKGGYLVSPEDMATLRAVIENKHVDLGRAR